MADQTLHLTDATFDSELGKHKEVMMVDFWRSGAPPAAPSPRRWKNWRVSRPVR